MLLLSRLPRTTRRRLALMARLGVIVGLVLSTTARAQGAPLRFVYVRGTDTLAFETLTPGSGVMRGVLEYRSQPRIEWEQTRAPLRLTLTVFAPGAAADAAPLQAASFVAQRDSIAAEIGARGAMRPQLFASKAGAVPLINNSLLHTALIGALARESGRSTVPLFLTNGAQTVDGTVHTTGDTTTVTIGGMGLQVVWQNGVPLEVRVPAQNLRAVRATDGTSGAGVAVPTPVSYDAPPDAPYASETVTIPTPRGYALAGTLTRPKGANGPVPVVVTISGSGPQDRDSRIPIVRDYAPFRDIADTLGRRGIAVLRYDDRGVGRSGGGGAMRDTATSEDFADDVLSVVQYMRTRPDVDGARIALAGHSEGGLIAPIAAVKDARIRAVALLAGPAHTGRKILEYQNENSIRAATVSETQRDSLRRTVPAALDSLARTNRWMRWFMATDPLVTARRVKQPVLILQGDTDQQVTPEQADTLAATMRRAGNRAVTLRRFPATNHLFLADSSGSPAGYTTLNAMKVRQDVLGALADWAVRTLGK